MQAGPDAPLIQAIAQQRAKVLALARRINPRLTDDDILSPMDFPELANDPQFNYEDGILAGLISAQAVVRLEGPPGSGAGSP